MPLDESGDDVGRIREGGRSGGAGRRRRRCSSAATIWSAIPIVAGLAEVHGPLNILHFDAHPDLYDDFEGDPLSHASPFARIMESRPRQQRWSRSASAPSTAIAASRPKRFGVEMVEMRHFRADAVPIPDAPLYVSIDLDALDPAFAPGVSHHEPGGLSVRDILNVLHRIEAPIVGADIVEYNPHRDINGVTAVVAAKLLKELAALAGKGSKMNESCRRRALLGGAAAAAALPRSSSAAGGDRLRAR